jgi:hypothetical protein
MRQSAALRERALSYVALYKSLGGTLPPARLDAGARAVSEPTK